MASLKIRNDDGKILYEIENPDLIELDNHWVAVHPHVRKKRGRPSEEESKALWRVTEIRTGSFISKGSSRDEAIKAAIERVNLIRRERKITDPISEAIKQLRKSTATSSK